MALIIIGITISLMVERYRGQLEQDDLSRELLLDYKLALQKDSLNYGRVIDQATKGIKATNYLLNI